MLAMPKVVDALEPARLRDRVKVIIGGRPGSNKLDAQAATAPKGVEVVRALLRD